MKVECNFLPYEDTHSFSKIAMDYLKGDEKLQPFYQYPVSLDGIKAAIKERENYPTNRKILVNELRTQYAGFNLSDVQEINLQKLLNNNSFTITTAHQPNIFTGHLYFVYKILHTIKLANELKKQMPENDFVPIYYMGSEDADLEELGHINLDGEKVEWETNQIGAVGRMHTKGLEKIIERLQGEFGNLPFGKQMVDLCKQAYSRNTNIQQATLYLVNELFKQFGLLVLIPDNAVLKRLFNDVVKKELTEQFSHKLVEKTTNAIGEHYKVQASGRDINMFYLSDDGQRNRIEIRDTKYEILNKQLSFTEPEILQELENHPERFSANVILRGVFQEMVLPNIAFIGGGGELAYWLELKDVFKAVGVPYPILILRNSFLLLENKSILLKEKLALEFKDLFKSHQDLLNEFIQKNSSNKLNLSEEKNRVASVYREISSSANSIDPTLQQHICSLQTQALKKLGALEKKMLRAEKRKFSDAKNQIEKFKNQIYPSGNLQERVDNFMPYFAKYGFELLDVLLQYSLGLEQQFAILSISE